MNADEHFAKFSRDLRPHFPRVSCTQCGAIMTWKNLEKMDWGEHRELFIRAGAEPSEDVYCCPVCTNIYVPDKRAPWTHLMGDEDDIGFHRHSGELVETAAWYQFHNRYVDMLFVLLGQARHYIGFTTYNISPQVLGAIIAAGLRGCAVHGIVSGVKNREWVYDNIVSLSENFEDGFEMRPFRKRAWNVEFVEHGAWRDMVHVKSLVVDGVALVRGSANLTIQGFKNASEKREQIEFAFDPDQVVDFTSEYISPHLLRLKGGTPRPPDQVGELCTMHINIVRRRRER